VEVESNDSLRQVFEQVSPTPNTGKDLLISPENLGLEPMVSHTMFRCFNCLAAMCVLLLL